MVQGILTSPAALKIMAVYLASSSDRPCEPQAPAATMDGRESLVAASTLTAINPVIQQPLAALPHPVLAPRTSEW